MEDETKSGTSQVFCECFSDVQNIIFSYWVNFQLAKCSEFSDSMSVIGLWKCTFEKADPHWIV